MWIHLSSKWQQEDQKCREGVPLKDMDWSGMVSQFYMDSSLHGLQYVGQPRRHFVERIFWLLSFGTAVTCATLLILEIWEKYRVTPIITVFQPEATPINLLPFPAITICNMNDVKKSKAVEYQRYNQQHNSNAMAMNMLPSGGILHGRKENAEMRIIKNSTDPHANQDLYMLHHICEASPTFTDFFNLSQKYDSIPENVIEPVRKFRRNLPPGTGWKYGRGVSQVVRDVAQKCKEMILLCLWGGKVHQCSSLFSDIETNFGHCCVFNMVPINLLMNLPNDIRDDKVRITDWDSLNLDTDNMILDNEFTFETEYKQIYGNLPKFPRRQRRPGKKTGLSILLDAEMDDYFCASTDSVGFMALAHLPLHLPDVENKGVPIKPGTETYLKVEPDVITAGPQIKEFSIEKRKCYFGQEYSLKYFKYYTKSNCENECVANVTNLNCSCVRFYMPRSENHHICGLSKRNCTESLLNRLFEDGLEAECPMCLPTCNDIEFKVSSTYAPLRQDIPLWEFKNGTQASWYIFISTCTKFSQG
ncbi:Pickpocket protein 28 [Folsomia candida]|uniref:Pickpocket protein 28 n=1 Tax=Folsomia candida TaxID=158441 RepID=A0A226DRB1_FOLCA|nr:Pickpocket protein 28 [Folsomia candida]